MSELTNYFTLVPKPEIIPELVGTVSISVAQQYVAFMCQLRHTEIDYLERMLQEYEIGNYIISMEVAKESHKETEGQHFHFIVQMSDKDYHKYSKRIFIDKYKLRGRAGAGLPKQYGKVADIQNLDGMLAYTVKDGKFRTNMTEQEIKQYVSKSFQKNEDKTFQEQLFTYLSAYNNVKFCEYGRKRDPTTKEIMVMIVDYYKANKIMSYCSKLKLESYTRKYQLQVLNMDSNSYVSCLFPFI